MNAASCILYKAGCDHTGHTGNTAFGQAIASLGDSCYMPSAHTKPATDILTCRWEAARAAKWEERDKCPAQANSEKRGVTACTKSNVPAGAVVNSCIYNPWRHAWRLDTDNRGCYLLEQFRLKPQGANAQGIYNDHAYTADECDRLCFEHPDCLEFYLHTPIDTRNAECTLYRGGCELTTNPTRVDRYLPTVHEKRSTAGLVCV